LGEDDNYKVERLQQTMEFKPQSNLINETRAAETQEQEYISYLMKMATPGLVEMLEGLQQTIWLKRKS
jgi:hypothetical protein